MHIFDYQSAALVCSRVLINVREIITVVKLPFLLLSHNITVISYRDGLIYYIRYRRRRLKLNSRTLFGVFLADAGKRNKMLMFRLIFTSFTQNTVPARVVLKLQSILKIRFSLPFLGKTFLICNEHRWWTLFKSINLFSRSKSSRTNSRLTASLYTKGVVRTQIKCRQYVSHLTRTVYNKLHG